METDEQRAAARGRDLELLAEFEPILRFTRGELFLPGRVEDYLGHTSLVAHRDGRFDVLAEAGSLTPADLAALGRRHVHDDLSLRYVHEPMAARDYRAWRRQHRISTPPLVNAAAAAGLIARGVAAAMRLSLLLRGRVPGGQAATAADQAARARSGDTAHYYGRVKRDGGYTVLQYWFFYPMNDWRSTFGGVNDHEGDWEQVTVFLAETPDGPRPAWVAFASHDEKGPDLRRRWDDPELEKQGDHPVAYIGAGSHSAACGPGDYLVYVAPNLPPWLMRVRTRLARVIPWWDPEASGIGIPFLDYRRGDGETIGPDRPRRWTRDLIDDETPWVRDYLGLWGLDTGDPLGGERAPAGPRYERDGRVRTSWLQPVAWADLDGEPPTHMEETLWSGRPASLQDQRTAAHEDLDVARRRLREAVLADRAQGRPPHRPGPERLAAQRSVDEANAALARVCAAADEQDRMSQDLPPRWAPDQHLRHRAVPLMQDRQARSAAVRAWASVSAAVLFGALGLLLVFGTSSVVAPALGLVLLMVLVEAALRRRLLALLVNLAVAAVVLGAVWVIVTLVIDNLRVGLGVILLLAGAVTALQAVADALVRPRRRRRDDP